MVQKVYFFKHKDHVFWSFDKEPNAYCYDNVDYHGGATIGRAIFKTTPENLIYYNYNNADDYKAIGSLVFDNKTEYLCDYMDLLCKNIEEVKQKEQEVSYGN